MTTMGREHHHQLHVFFFPFMAHGHMIPTVDMAKLFTSKGVKCTVVTTPQNEPFISKSIQRSKTNSETEITILILKFPSAEVGLPEGYENVHSITHHPFPIREREARIKFLKATCLLQQPLEQLLQEHKPDCLIADMFFPWATESASKFNILRLVFHGTSFFALSAVNCVEAYKPHKKVLLDEELFVIPHLPGDIKLTRKQVPDEEEDDPENSLKNFWKDVYESDSKCYGAVFNSFYELESVYEDFYRNFWGRKVWHIGPLSLCNKNIEDKVIRGRDSTINEYECLKWLDLKKPNSVVYICFGSIANFTSAQLMEIATGIEASGIPFIWVVRRDKNYNDSNKEDWLPEGFEENNRGRGMIIRGWAPQVLILDHESVGGFVTHCGWNSTLEGITAGVPMVTWPVSAEQFYNEKLVTDVLRVGLGVGSQQWTRLVGDFVKSEKVEKAVKELMLGDTAEERRRRAKELAEMARKAVEVGGSSHSNLDALIEELEFFRN